MSTITEAKSSQEQLPRLKKKIYEKELKDLQAELVKLQEWISANGLRVVVVFEGRDAAGKGGVIKRITSPMSPRIARVAALAKPTEKEQGQWYFQRYVAQLPSAGEMVLFDRSWYNRAGVERVMGFCTDEEYQEFLHSCPQFERLLIRSGIILVKYWFSVSDEEQEDRFESRLDDPTRRWKLSPMDLQARSRWVEYSKAKDAMFVHCDTADSPWWVVEADQKRRARINCISHLLNQIPYEDLTPPPLELPPRQQDEGYERPDISTLSFVPELFPEEDGGTKNGKAGRDKSGKKEAKKPAAKTSTSTSTSTSKAKASKAKASKAKASKSTTSKATNSKSTTKSSGKKASK